MWFVNTHFQSVVYLFIISTWSFAEEMFSILMKSADLSVFPFMYYASVSSQRASLPSPRSRFSLCLYLKYVIALHLRVKSVIHLVNFCIGVEFRVKLCLFIYFLVSEWPVAPVLFVENVLLPLNCFSHLYQQLLTVFLWLHFWNLCSVPLLCLYLYLDYCSYTVSLNIGWVIPPLDLYKIVLAVLPMTFFIDFRISLCVQKSCWDFDRNCIKSIGQFGENWYFKYVGLSSYNHNMCIHLFRSPLISFTEVL